jgi:hypothetical protein
MTITKQQLDALLDTNTIVLALDAGTESQVAFRWLQKHAPKALQDQRVLTELHLMQLQAAVSVCAVFRYPVNAAVNYEPDKAGVIRTYPRPDAELFEEMHATKPVKVGDYWDRPSPTSPGKPDVPRFLDALQQTLVPYRLDFIDKGEAKPSIMKLAAL